MRRHRASTATCLQDYVRAGILCPVLPTTDTGYKSYGPGRLFLPSATNYCTNPSFEVDSNADGLADGLAVYGTLGGAKTYSLVNGEQRLKAVGAAGDGTGDGWFMSYGAGHAFDGDTGDPCTLQIEAKVNALTGCTARLGLRFFTAGWGIVHAEYVDITSSDWTTYATSIPVLGADIDPGKTQIYVVAAAFSENDVIDISVRKPMISKSSILTPYFDGDTPGCSWSGTANASASVRAASVLAPNVAGLGVPRTMAFRLVPLFSSTDATTKRFMYVNGGLFYFQHNSGNWVFGMGDGVDTAVRSLSPGTWAAGTGHTVVARPDWNGTLDGNVDGVDITQQNAAPVDPPALSSIHIGGTNGTAYAYIGPVLVSSVRKSQAWVDAIQANGGAAYSDPMRLVRDFMAVGDGIAPLNGDSVMYVKVA
jgi:hypothetical protein